MDTHVRTYVHTALQKNSWRGRREKHHWLRRAPKEVYGFDDISIYLLQV